MRQNDKIIATVMGQLGRPLIESVATPPAPTAEVPPTAPDSTPAPEVKPMSHDEWASACQPLLPEGSEVERNTCVYVLSGVRYAQKCQKNEAGTMILEGEPMKIETPVAAAPPAAPEVPPPAESGASAEVVALKAQLEAATKALAARDLADKDAAFAAAGVKPDLAEMVKSTATRNEGETWTQAVERVKKAMPSAFASEPAKATAPAAEIVPVQTRMPAGATIADRSASRAAGAPVSRQELYRQRAEANSAILDTFDGRN